MTTQPNHAFGKCSVFQAPKRWLTSIADCRSKKTVIKIHGAPPSAPTRRAIAAVEEKGLNYEFVLVDMATAQHKKQPFISINYDIVQPYYEIETVPVFEDGDMKPCESRFITGYIARTYAGEGTPLVPSDPKEWTAVIQWSEVESQQFDPTASKLSCELVIKAIFGRTTDEAAVEELKAKLMRIQER
ncbi:hypothetical protein M569_02864 [Genlisea aurea]|uniref:glutathione transferase n=1 Tax=Genlisea aurea TaxID=192259 RepID=S8CX04_9LAMI|nr:hypothetical protein M569_02864 [Genlisea aurea]